MNLKVRPSFYIELAPRIIKDIETHMRDRARLAKELEVALQDPDEVRISLSLYKTCFI